MREALYYELYGDKAACRLCPHACVIKEGGRGICRVRQNTDNKLYTLNYAMVTSCGLDSIEKKPLYHFYPGSKILSLGTWGCNFTCQFCQNHEISQGNPEAARVPPEMAVKLARDAISRKNIGLAYTYSEPGVWFEYILDTALLVRREELRNVMVTNGFINKEPLLELLPYIDAINIDVKAFNNDFYRDVCSGSLQAVLQTVEEAARACHVEVTTLLVPGLNDSEGEIRQLASWLKDIDDNIPLHFSRYFPKHKMNIESTPETSLAMAAKIAREYLKYVYIGNISGDGVNTYCPSCDYLLIDRLKLHHNLTFDKKCPICNFAVNIIGAVRIEKNPLG